MDTPVQYSTESAPYSHCPFSASRFPRRALINGPGFTILQGTVVGHAVGSDEVRYLRDIKPFRDGKENIYTPDGDLVTGYSHPYITSAETLTDMPSMLTDSVYMLQHYQCKHTGKTGRNIVRTPHLGLNGYSESVLTQGAAERWLSNVLFTGTPCSIECDKHTVIVFGHLTGTYKLTRRIGYAVFSKGGILLRCAPLYAGGGELLEEALPCSVIATQDASTYLLYYNTPTSGEWQGKMVHLALDGESLVATRKPALTLEAQTSPPATARWKGAMYCSVVAGSEVYYQLHGGPICWRKYYGF
jgi:hypothetical protein